MAARRAVRHADAPDLLRRYDDPTGGYAGSTFLDLKPNDPHDLPATDLCALSLLDVRATRPPAADSFSPATTANASSQRSPAQTLRPQPTC
ncbi:MAG: hypothetical protein AVDCRST_MAG48-934 [uncultured Friedmanniella sp.]|uniref:Uncharacterized protein n=1 Tax=uncultured Friedmanniella sp. TaxID=335381 RepID=A0A6J4K4N1_9ACTN|nr:MAG: hypothetical protein AVDCRST_MAG48-934 [uncultured Friedmanniella sp.]